MRFFKHEKVTLFRSMILSDSQLPPQ